VCPKSDTICQRGRYYSDEGRERNQMFINIDKDKRHLDRGRNPMESSVRERSLKGRYPLRLMSKGER
jgi:hypothetical protein